jgi:hypothetical protein
MLESDLVELECLQRGYRNRVFRFWLHRHFENLLEIVERRLGFAIAVHNVSQFLKRTKNEERINKERDAQKAWRPAPENLERICAFRHERVVSNDNVVQWEGRRLQIPQQHRRFSFAGAKVQLYQTLDGRLAPYYGDTRLEHIAIAG